MTEKEAREIIGKGIPPPLQAIESIKYQHARSYLAGFDEALDKAKGLEEALSYSCNNSSLKCDGRCGQEIRKKALSEWRKVK